MPAAEPASLLPLVAFALASVWTPGPNNVMLAASGASFGFRATLRHILGVATGFALMLFLVALGLGEVFRSQPGLRAGLAWAGCAVMLWLAWRIATARPAGEGRRGRPLGYLEAAGFQWINPKAWVLAISVSASFASGAEPLAEAAVAAGVFALAGLSSASGWAAFGAGIGRLLGTGWRLRAFNIAMAAVLAVSAVALVLEG